MSGYGKFALVYDYLNNEVDYKKKAEYFNTILIKNGAKKNGILLDAACGTGSLSIEMAKKHWNILGCDSSCEMLSRASFKIQQYDYPINFICQKLENLDLYSTVDAVVCIQDSLNHILGSKNLQKALNKISSFLNIGGIFSFDLNTVYKHNKILANNTFCYDYDDAYLIWKNTLLKNNVVNIELDIFIRENKFYRKYSESFREQAYSDDEIKHMLYKSGFNVLHTYKEDTFLLPDESTQRIVYVARKE